MLSLVGLGLHDVRDITVRGLETVRAADRVVAEFYTARLTGTPHEELESFLGRSVEVLNREGVEFGGRDLVADAATRNVVLLTAGDPLAATTHTDLVVRARGAGVPVEVIHAASIYSAAPGLAGLQHYKFGRTVTLVRPEPNWLPTSPFDGVAANHHAGLHTLALLDIKADEDYYMTGQEGLALLLRLAQATDNDWFNETTPAAIVARAGAPDCRVVTGTVGELVACDVGGPLHCIIIPGELQVVEQEAWDSLAVTA